LEIKLVEGEESIVDVPERIAKAITEPTLARVYGFSYEGRYYEMARPTIFLVNGDGAPSNTAVTSADEPKPNANLMMWSADQADFSMRLDLDIGTFERLLLEAELGPDVQRLGFAGQSARLDYAGQNARLDYSGQSVRLRYAGQSARLRGGSGSSD
jgi:hypothetical protein